MKHFGYGCSMVLGGWLLIALAIAFWLQDSYGVRITDTFGIAAVAGLLGWGGLGLLFSAAVRLRERFTAQAALDGAMPRDGAGAVVIGTVQGHGTPLLAPFNGEECFAYSYRVSHDNGKSGKRRTVIQLYEGYALAPCAIATETGYFRLLTVPWLDPVTTCSSGTSLAAAQRYVAATTFLPQHQHLPELKRRWEDADGSYRSDIGRPLQEGMSWQRCTLVQQVLRPKATVCVIGYFSSDQRGFVPAPPWAKDAYIYQCSGAELLRKLTKSVLWRLFWSLVLSAAAAGLVAAFISDHLAKLS